MPKKEYLAEHKQLTDVLARPTKAKLGKELAKQTAEVKMRGGTAVAMPKTLNDAWEEFKHHWKDRAVVNHNEFYGELKHIVRDIGGLTEPKATALIKVFRDQGWRKGLGAMGKIWEMVIDWEPKSLYAGSGKDDFDFPVVRKGDKRVELSGPRTAAMMNQKRREKAEAERRIRERAEREEAERIARQRQIDASDEERERERRRAQSRDKVSRGFGHSAYLRQAKAKAKAYGLDPKKLKVATDGKHKFSYDGVLFGAMRYGDHLLWSAEEKAGRVPKGTAEKKRKQYRARAEKIKGDWKANKTSPNNLAIHILW